MKFEKDNSLLIFKGVRPTPNINLLRDILGKWVTICCLLHLDQISKNRLNFWTKCCFYVLFLISLSVWWNCSGNIEDKGRLT